MSTASLSLTTSPHDLDEAAPKARAAPHITPSDAHEAIGNQSASILESHSMHVVARIDRTIETLTRLKEQLVRESREARGMIDRHTRVMRAAESLAGAVDHAYIDANQEH